MKKILRCLGGEPFNARIVRETVDFWDFYAIFSDSDVESKVLQLLDGAGDLEDVIFDIVPVRKYTFDENAGVRVTWLIPHQTFL